MRVAWAWRSSGKRPYRMCVIGITIWSFLITTVSSLAPPECTAQTISPRSRFCEAPQIAVNGSDAVLCENDKLVSEEFRRDACLLQTHLITAKVIKYNYPIYALQQLLSRTTKGSVHVFKIPKNEGLYIKYREDKNSPERIAHYFIKEENSHTGKYKLIKDDFEKPVYIEEITEAEFVGLKKEIKVLFTPEGHCHRAIADAIDSAQNCIDAAIFNFDNEEIVQALERAKSRGVKIRVHLHNNSKIEKRLKKEGFDVRSKLRKSGLMHDKFMIIDNEIVYSGSYNWTDKAESNRENVIVLPCATPFMEEFKYMWEGEKDKLWPQRDTAPPGRVGVLFSPRDRCNECIKNIISQAIKENPAGIPTKIQIALYFFTDNEIAEKLFEAKEKGFDIEILLDKTQESRKDSVVKHLFDLQQKANNKGLPSRGRGSLKIRYHRIEGVTMHNKFAIIGNTTVTGSYNWTKSAWQKNNENLVIIPSIVEEYADEFERLWKEPGAEITLDKGNHLRPPSTAPPPKHQNGYWKYTPESTAYENSFENWKTKSEEFSGNGKNQYEVLDKDNPISKKFIDGMTEDEKKAFKGKISVCIARKNLMVRRYFDSDIGDTKKSKREGGWFIWKKLCHFYPALIKEWLHLYDDEGNNYNNAEMRIRAVIKENAIFAKGAIRNGHTSQLFIPRKNISKQTLFFKDTIESWVWRN
ncbi:MAG: phospholipase D-like domain-containing protein [Candidatus Omnitrophota bacterium]